MRSQIHSTNSTAWAATMPVSRRKEIALRRRGQALGVGELQREEREDDADDRLADAACRAPRSPRLRCLKILM